MKRISVAVLLLLWITAMDGQRIVTLQQCYDSAAAVTPLAREGELYSGIAELRDRNLSSAYLPALDLNGSFVYNSDILDIAQIYGQLPVPPEVIPTIPNEQYRATLDINQVIWDGGVTRSARAVEAVVREVNMQQNEADIYRLREQINNYFFSILLLSMQIDVTRIMADEIDARIRDTESGVANGVLPAVTTDMLFAEKVKIMQLITEMRYRQEGLLTALGMITGMGDLRGAALVMPEQSAMPDTIVYNPDLALFSVRSRQLEVSKELLKSQRMPKAFGFAQLGYGNPPGSNVFAENPDVYYSLGAGIKWNIFDWHRSSNERKALALQQQLLEARMSAAEESLERVLAIKKSEIASLREIAKSDDIVVALKKKIAASAASQMKNGAITATEYLTELNGERQALINAGMRLIGIARAEAEYMTITGSKQ